MLLGYVDVRSFQAANGLTVDNVSGKTTRAAMHKLLLAVAPVKNTTVVSSVGRGVLAGGAAVTGAALFFDDIKTWIMGLF